MSTFFECLLMLLFFGFISIQALKYFSHKRQIRLESEIENDLNEEFPVSEDGEDFLAWAEELQLEHDIVQRKNQ